MKINEHNNMMGYLTRPGKVLANNINDKKINDSGARTALKRGGSDTKPAPKKAKILEFIDDNIAMYEPDTATKEQLEGLEKRLANARAFVTPPKEKKKMSKQDFYDTYFNRKSPKYYKAEKPKPIKPDLVNGHSDWTTDDWLQLIDPGGWSSPEDEGKRSGILEQELANEYWQQQYQNYQNNGGTLSYPLFMQQQLNNKISKKINKIAEDKKQTEGLAAILGVKV